MTKLLSVEHHVSAGASVIKIPSRVTMAQCDHIEFQIEALLGNERVNLVLDLGETEFVDSSGLAVFIKAMKYAKSQQGELCMANIQSQMSALLDLTCLDEVFAIFGSVTEALEYLESK